jgi:hypothetical protein
VDASSYTLAGLLFGTSYARDFNPPATKSLVTVAGNGATSHQGKSFNIERCLQLFSDAFRQLDKFR